MAEGPGGLCLGPARSLALGLSGGAVSGHLLLLLLRRVIVPDSPAEQTHPALPALCLRVWAPGGLWLLLNCHSASESLGEPVTALRDGQAPAPRGLSQRLCIQDEFPGDAAPSHAGPHPENLWSPPNATGTACVHFWPVRGGAGLQLASWRKGPFCPWTCCETGGKVPELLQPV